MRFVYTYKTSDGIRHEGIVDASDREAAFAALRERGIRAMRVEPEGWKTGAGRTVGLKRWLVGLILVAVAGVGFGIYLGRRSPAVIPPAKQLLPVLSDDESVAKAMPRRQLRETVAVSDVFSRPSEQFLARYAEPGKEVEPVFFTEAVVDDFLETMNDAIVVDGGDSHGVLELKRIVAGMKEELALYLKAGKGVRDYAEFLQNRQTMEVQFRRDLQAKVESGEMPIEDANNRLGVMGFAKIPVTRMGEKK